MIFCFDTDILIEYFRGNEKIKDRINALSENDSIGLTLLSFYEFFKGIFVIGKLEEETSSPLPPPEGEIKDAPSRGGD